jgi:riboflavin biosynthesis pyrimidine reductase
LETLMKPHVTCLMLSSVDGRLHPSRYTESPDGSRQQWSKAYETLHDSMAADAWMVGRVTMAEMSATGPHAPPKPWTVDRAVHVASDAKRFAIALDRSGKLHFEGGAIGGDHVIVLLGAGVSDSHLAELAADGVSYVVADTDDIDIVAALETLGDAFGIRTILLEGGGGINGALLAAGVVDELGVLVTPALDGGTDVQGIVIAGPDGLAGKVTLTLKGADVLDHGIVHLRYGVQAA